MNEFIKCIRYLLKPVRLVNLYRHIKTNSLLKRKKAYAAIGSELNNADIAEYVWIGEGSVLSNATLGKHTYVGGG